MPSLAVPRLSFFLALHSQPLGMGTGKTCEEDWGGTARTDSHCPWPQGYFLQYYIKLSSKRSRKKEKVEVGMVMVFVFPGNHHTR